MQLIQAASLLRVYKNQQGVDIVTPPLPFDVGGRFRNFKPSRPQPIWGPNPKSQNQEVLCLSESLGCYAKCLARGRFLYLIPPSSNLDYGGCHIPGEIKDFCG